VIHEIPESRFLRIVQRDSLGVADADWTASHTDHWGFIGSPGSTVLAVHPPAGRGDPAGL